MTTKRIDLIKGHQNGIKQLDKELPDFVDLISVLFECSADTGRG